MTPRQQSILIGAVVTGILSTSYLSFINTICCLGVIIGGLVAVQQYTSLTRTSIEASDGAIIGALAGIGGAVLGALFDQMLRPFGLDSQTIWQGILENSLQGMEGMEGQQGMSPELMQQFQGEQGILMFLVGLLFSIVLYAIFGAIGGALGSAFFGETEEPGL